MFINQLAKKIEGWRGDSALFIEVPLSKRVISRSKTYDLVHQIAALINQGADCAKTTVGFCFEEPANWVLAVIATQIARAVAVPIPKEFTAAQISSFVPNLDLVLTDSPELATKLSALIGPNSEIETKNI